MGSPGSEDRTYILSINIQDGKGFGPDLQAVACAATFAGETKLTSYSVGRDTHVWNATLQWRVTMDQFRRLTSLGQKDCKVVLSNKDGTKLGWFLVDVRAAKLQAQYKKVDGAWMTLTGAKKGDAPQVCMVALFYEDRPGVSFSPEPKQSPSKSRAAAGAARRQQAASRPTAAPAGDSQPDQDPAEHQPVPPGDSAATEAVATGAPLVSGAPSSPNPTAGLPNFGSPSRDPADDGPFRHFALTLDVRSFQSSKRLPLSSASVYIQAVLPADLIELVVGSGFRLPSRLAPLRSHPAVDIPRGAEGAIPNGYGTMEFSAGVVQLARVLAREPRVSVEAWHKERFRTDMLLGAGSVPLTPLLQGAWVDGYAPLFALVASSSGGEVREERVQMGLLRVVLSLEDKGPAAPTGGGGGVQAAERAPPLIPPGQAGAGALGAGASSAAAATAPPPPEVLRPRPSPYDLGEGAAAAVAGGGDAMVAPAARWGEQLENTALSILEVHPAPPPADRGATSVAAEALPSSGGLGQPPLPQPYIRANPPAVSLGSPPALSRAAAAAAAAAAAVGGRAALPPSFAGGAASMLQGAGPEFEAAWELEVWKKAEEARWRAELREREAQRMLVLESEWRRRERAREAEIASLKAEYLALEGKAQQALAAAEARERRILAAEEALLRRRKELEREHAARMVEAEAAVRRLQVECEHQLDIERDRNAELVRRGAALEERLAASEARCHNVENEFADFRAAARSTPEAELARQLAEAREAVKAAEARAVKSAKAKQGYKEQVRKLAEQMAALQQRHRHHNRRGSSDDGVVARGAAQAPGTGLAGLAALGPDPSAIRAVAEEQARYAALQQQELAAIRAQLRAIKAAALSQLSPPSSPRRPAEAGGGIAAAVAEAPAGRSAAAADAADEAADLRSSDQQRRSRVQWNAGAGSGGVRAGAGGDSNDTPMSRPAGVGSHAANSSSTTSTPAADGSTSSSTHSPTAQQQQQQQRGTGTAGPAPTRAEDAGPGHSGGLAPARQRWAEPRAAASAPPPPPAGGVSTLAPGAGIEPGSSGKAASAPATVRSVSTSMTRTMAAATVAAAAPAPQQLQPQRRGWDPVERPREPAHWEDEVAQERDEDSDDSRWDDDAGRQRWRRRQQPQRDVTGAAAAANPGGGGDDHDGEDDQVQRRSLADHLANASSAASRLRERQLLELQQQNQPQRGSGGASSTQQPDGRGPAGSARANWQLPPQQQQQQPRAGAEGYGDADTGYKPSEVGARDELGGGDDGGGPDADLEQLRRLTRRKVELLQRGHGPDDPLVASLDDRIQALLVATAGVPLVRR